MSSDPREDLRTLRRVMEVLWSEHTIEYALHEITDAALTLAGGDHASIRLLDASGTRLLAAARSGAGTEVSSFGLARGEGIAGWALDHCVSVRVGDARADPRFVAAIGQGFVIRSIVAEPLLSSGSAIGVLSVSSPAEDAFSEEDAQLVRILANCSVPRLVKDRLERLTLTDELTLAFAAPHLLPCLKKEMDRARHAGSPFSVLVTDLDGLDRLNSAFGRELGDFVLATFARRVRELLRSYDAIIRWGGDEFVVVLAETSPAQALVLAERIRTTMATQPMEPRPGARLTQTVSMGVATWNGAESPEHLLDRAARAVLDAKAEGGNAVARAHLAEAPP